MDKLYATERNELCICLSKSLSILLYYLNLQRHHMLKVVCLKSLQIIDPFVEVEIVGVASDCGKKQTSVIDDNGKLCSIFCVKYVKLICKTCSCVSVTLKWARLIDRPVTRGRMGEKPPKKNVRPPWKNLLDVVQNYWTQLKKLGLLSENFSPILVSQAVYEPAYRSSRK